MFYLKVAPLTPHQQHLNEAIEENTSITYTRAKTAQGPAPSCKAGSRDGCTATRPLVFQYLLMIFAKSSTLTSSMLLCKISAHRTTHGHMLIKGSTSSYPRRPLNLVNSSFRFSHRECNQPFWSGMEPASSDTRMPLAFTRRRASGPS